LAWDIILVASAAILLLIGFAGTFVPILPGAPLAWLGLLLAYFSKYSHLALWLLILCLVIAIVVSVADNIFPVIMTKKAGGSKKGSWGCTLGLVAGFFLGPLGIIFCPLLGAFIGELIENPTDKKKALRAALSSFYGFLMGLGLKMIAVLVFIWIYICSLL